MDHNSHIEYSFHFPLPFSIPHKTVSNIHFFNEINVKYWFNPYFRKIKIKYERSICFNNDVF